MRISWNALVTALMVTVFLYTLMQITAVQGQNPEIQVNPSSILVPVNTVASFECIAYCVNECDGFWLIRGRPTENSFQKSPFIDEGFDFPDSPATVGSFRTTITVNASVDLNDTTLQCHIRNTDHTADYYYAESDIAVLQVLSEPLVKPNPSLTIQPTSYMLKWCPPYLWPGHRIKYYAISLTNMTNGTVTYENISASTLGDYVVTLEKSRHGEDCAKYEFALSAVSTNDESLKPYEIGGEYQQALEELDETAIHTSVLFFANLTPIVTIEVQLPSMICDHQDVNYTISVDGKNESDIIELGPFHHQGSGTIKYDIVSDELTKGENYSVRLVLSTSLDSVTSQNYSFDTNFVAEIQSTPKVCVGGDGLNYSSSIQGYNTALGICVCVLFIVLTLGTFVTSIWIHYCFKLRKQRRTAVCRASAERVCNAMIPNPIYNGPIYESVQPHFEIITSRALQDSKQVPGEQHSNSQASTPTSSEKSDRYVDPPHHPSTDQSNSFVSGGPLCPSTLAGDTSNNIPRSEGVSMTAIKKPGKQRNKFNLTLTLDGKVSSCTTRRHNDRRDTGNPISAVNPMMLTDVDENYMLMSSPAGTAKTSELSPEDTDKYKE